MPYRLPALMTADASVCCSYARRCHVSIVSLSRCRPSQHCSRDPLGQRPMRHKRRRHAWHAHAPRAVADVLMFVPPMCFDQECQRAVDQTFLLAICTPILVLAAAIAYALRPLSADAQAEGRVFVDKASGNVFEAVDGAQPERDRKGELAFRAVSYTPWPVEEGYEGERLRISVGALNSLQPRTYVFQKLRQPSKLVAISLPRPLGVLFEEDKAHGRVVVAALAPGSPAGQRAKVAQMNPALRDAAVLEGDVLRACTCTTLVYPTRALFGAKPPKRTIVLYGCDGERWPDVASALKRGFASDGQVTLVLERPVHPDMETMTSEGA